MLNNKIKKYKMSELIEAFDLKVANLEHADLERETLSPSIHRTGLELAGAYDISHTATNIIAWGTKEDGFLSKFSVEESKKVISKVLTKKTPMILLSVMVSKKTLDAIVEVANEFKIPVVPTKHHLSTLRATIGAELVERFAAQSSVHGSLVIVDGIGVMVIGKSGVGKSEAVLELIQKGHSFISDDTVVIKQIGKSFIGRAAELTKGLLEARGIGLINIPYIYGHKAIRDSIRIGLVIELVPQDQFHEFDRLGNKELRYKVLDGEIPLMQIPVNQGRSISSLIEAGTNVFTARKSGLDPIKEMKERRDLNE